MAEACTSSPSHRLSVTDSNSGFRFLIDTGAEVSVLPVKNKQSFGDSECKLYAANGSEIKTYGTKTLELKLGLRRAYRWSFIIADVKQPILGADFLTRYGLLVDLRAKKLIDCLTNMSVIASVEHCINPSIKIIDENHPFHGLLSRFPDITKPVSFKEPPSHHVRHHIETRGPPIFSRARPLPPDRYKKVKDEFRLMQEMGICRPSKSPWASPLHVVPKKNGELRPCGDYRRLNEVTKSDRYPIPRIQDFTYFLTGKKCFSTLDINRAYHFIPVADEDIEKTAIITPFGLWEFPKMSFGLKNAAQTFQRFMNTTVFPNLDFLFVYIDDVLIASETEEEHERHLRTAFERLNQFGITINVSKCAFGKSKLDFLGFEVSTEGIRPLPEKVQAIVDYPRPETIQDLRRFLGMANFYRAHIPDAAKQQAELNKFLHNSKKRDKTKIQWTEESIAAFDQCKQSLRNAATLCHPQTGAPIALMADASDFAVGAVLQTKVGDSWKPLGYFSKRLTSAQIKYSTYDRELLAIFMAVRYFRKMFEGQPLIILTDHKPLTYAFKGNNVDSNKETPRRARQLLFISEFTTDIRYIEGKKNIAADCLSRVETISCPTSIDFDEVAVAQERDDYIANAASDGTCNNNNLRFKKVVLPTSNKSILCETSTSFARPYLPVRFRQIAFKSVHNLSHPGIRTTRKMMTSKFFWPGMNRDIGVWAKCCLPCQRAKVTRHTVSEFNEYPSVERFEHINVDIVGPLPITVEGYRYCVTIIDRKTRWPEAFPVKEITAECVAKTIFDGWITRYGCPLKLTSDQGRQFESSLFSSLMKILGIKKIRTTPYHPISNGLIERFHRSMKASLKASLDCTSWVDQLPSVLLGLRAALRSDNGVSAAEMTFGRNIRLPGDFYDLKEPEVSDDSSLVEKIRHTISKFKPALKSHSNSKAFFVHPDLKTCSKVFVRDDTVRRPLKSPYDGPYQVIKRYDKVYKIKFPDRVVNISIDRLKPAYVLNDASDMAMDQPIPDSTDRQTNLAPKDIVLQPPMPRTTKSGRLVRRPIRFDVEYH